MLKEISQQANDRMQKTLDSLKSDFQKMRTGRAHAGLLDQIVVDYYGAETPLNQVANVTATDARTLTVAPWDKSMVAAIEKAIMNSDLGLNPATTGTTVRVPMPPLTEERRKDLIKVVRNEAEQAKVALRNIRRDANGQIKDLLKEKSITEDEVRRAEEQVQKLTDTFVKQVDEVLSTKEKDLLEI